MIDWEWMVWGDSVRAGGAKTITKTLGTKTITKRKGGASSAEDRLLRFIYLLFPNEAIHLSTIYSLLAITPLYLSTFRPPPIVYVLTVRLFLSSTGGSFVLLAAFVAMLVREGARRRRLVGVGVSSTPVPARFRPPCFRAP